MTLTSDGEPLVQALQRARARWSLTALANPFSTHTGLLQKVRGAHGTCMLKVTKSPEEERGYDLLEWWRGRGAASVLERQGAALLMPFADGGTLLPMSSSGHDAEATRIFLSVRADLHASRPAPSPASLITLPEWFDCLLTASDVRLMPVVPLARKLLKTPCQPVPLHGDLHHDNIMHFSGAGWLAIDPKGLFGNPLFDLGAYFLNPDGARSDVKVARSKQVFDQRLATICSSLGVEYGLVADWITITAALSAAWAMRDGFDPSLAFDVIALANRHISRIGDAPNG